MNPTIDLRTVLEFLAMILTPVFAAGGAWVSIKFLREDLREVKGQVERLDRRVVNLYQYLRAPLPVDPEHSVN